MFFQLPFHTYERAKNREVDMGMGGRFKMTKNQMFKMAITDRAQVFHKMIAKSTIGLTKCEI